MKFHFSLIQKLWLLLVIFILPVWLSAQNRSDYGIFMEAALDYSILFNGELPMNYGKSSPNDRSTYFAYSIDFEKGDVLYGGKLYQDIYLNLNAHLDELYVKDPVDGLFLLLKKDFVGSFSIAHHQFIHYKPTMNSLLKDGFYEVLYDGKVKLYKKIDKLFYEKVVTGTKINRGFTLVESFYLYKENNWVKVTKKSNITKLFSEKKSLINNFLKRENLNLKKEKQLALVSLIIYLDQI